MRPHLQCAFDKPPSPEKMAGSARRIGRSRNKSTADVDKDRNPLLHANLKNRIRKNRSRDQSFIGILDVNLKLLLGFGILAFLIVLFLIHHIVSHPEDAQKPRVVTPFPAPKLMDLPMVDTYLCNVISHSFFSFYTYVCVCTYKDCYIFFDFG